MAFGKNFRTRPLDVPQLLQIVRPALRALYESATTAVRRSAAAATLYRSSIAPAGGGFDDDLDPARENFEYVQGMEMLEAARPVRVTAAFAIIAAGDALIAEAEIQLPGRKPKDHTRRDSAGPPIGGVRFGAFLRATVNNWRHYSEWGDEDPENRLAIANITILRDAGLEEPWNEVLSDRAFELLRFPSYEAFETALAETLTELCN